MSRVYVTYFDNISISAIQDILSLQAGVANGIEIHQIDLTAGVTSPASVRLRLKVMSGTVALGSGGTIPAISPVDDGNVQASFSTVHANDSTQATGTIAALKDYQWNVLLPWQFFTSVEDRIILQAGEAFVLDCPAAPSFSINVSGVIKWRELSAEEAAPPPSGYNNLSNWPQIVGLNGSTQSNRPTWNSSNNTLSWIGPSGGGASTSSDVQQSLVLTNSGSIASSSNGQVIEGLNITGTDVNTLVEITHSDVTLRRCRIKMTRTNTSISSVDVCVDIASTASNCIIEDCLIDGGGDSPGITFGSAGFGDVGITFNGNSNATIRRNTICHLEKGVGYNVSGALIIDNLFHAPAGYDQDFGYEGYPTGGPITGVIFRHNYATSSDYITGTGVNPNSGCQLTTWPGGNIGTAAVPILVDNNAFDVASAHMLLMDESQAAGSCYASVTNNGFTSAGGPGSSTEYSGSLTIVTNSGNYNMATPLATSGTPLNGTGVW